MVQQKVKYTDTERTPAERARALLEEMTLDEKMAQLGCIFPFGDSYDDMEQQALEMPYGIGQVSTLEMRRIGTLEEAAGWQRKMQETVMRQSPHHIPAIFHMEGLCGAFIQEGTSFPSGIARGSGWDPGAGREDSQSGGKTGSSLRHHSHSGSGAGYFKGFPHGKDRERPTGKTRLWRQLWERHIRKESRQQRQAEEDRKVSPSIFSDFTIHRAVFTERTVIRRPGSWKKYTASLSSLRFLNPS